MIRLVAGLGNPDKKYENTRHNLGFVVLDILAKKYKAKWKNYLSEIETTKVMENRIALVKPARYMNNSGPVLNRFMEYYRFLPDDLLVVLDDFSLPLGTTRFRASGSSGGHNGLESIIGSLGTKDFARLRLGIGPVPQNIDPADFVLSKFSHDEKPSAAEMAEKAADIVEEIVSNSK
jgi:peptidyl-tRNA hydrolase, PTH1 family